MMTGRLLSAAAALLLVLVPALSGLGQSRYGETVSCLRNAFVREKEVHRHYLAYAARAKSDGYPNMAYLFLSFAASESIHAHNMKAVLKGLGVEASEPGTRAIRESDTRTNLKNALDLELEDIDTAYPDILSRLRPEGHDGAIRAVTWAWESEKQHRDLIEKMRSGTGIFFGVLADRIERGSPRYFLCGLCGSTVVKLPVDGCPICRSPASSYKEVEGPR